MPRVIYHAKWEKKQADLAYAREWITLLEWCERITDINIIDAEARRTAPPIDRA